MNCRSAIRDLPALDAGALSDARRHAVAAHLATCPACATRAAAESDAVGALAALRLGAPPAIDVTTRVMRAIDAARAPTRDEVRPAQLGWAAVAATVAAGLIAGRLAVSLPDLVRATGDGAGPVGAMAAVTWALVEPILALAGVLGRLGLVALDAAGPALGATLVAAVAVTVATSAAIVTRELMFGPLPAARRSEEFDR